MISRRELLGSASGRAGFLRAVRWRLLREHCAAENTRLVHTLAGEIETLDPAKSTTLA